MTDSCGGASHQALMVRPRHQLRMPGLPRSSSSLGALEFCR
jgi:hypothetical protein